MEIFACLSGIGVRRERQEIVDYQYCFDFLTTQLNENIGKQRGASKIGVHLLVHWHVRNLTFCLQRCWR